MGEANKAGAEGGEGFGHITSKSQKPLVLLGEAWGANEARTQTPFCGASGVELLKMLDQAGVIALTAEDHAFIQKFWNTTQPAHIDMIWRMHPEVYRTNVLNLHPPGNKLEALCVGKKDGDPIPGYPPILKTKYLSASLASELERLADELIRLDPNLVVALGNTPLWALCGTTGVSKLRGTTRLSTHTVSGFKVLPTYHPAAVLRQWELRPTTLIDLMKAAREREFPEIRRPEREIWIEPTLEDLETFYDNHIRGCRVLSVDVETAGTRITCIGFAPHSGVALVVPFDDTRRKGKSYWSTPEMEGKAWVFVRKVLEDRRIHKVFQNGMYDIAFIWRSVKIRVYGATHDTMLLSHALQPESLKGLGYLGSVYTDEGAWKQERRSKTIKRDA